ncbi:hypothetical protein U14_05110 [Candidatus Moduliflexus flocculans]|uniref:Extracellular solute-binding protein n=1 Tax=Candidatus Moduliflexus flocculans TaxID=1499966 RepID=A0A081BR05_9BACT|nr:hypothetical protein U14_05110 [Candidatus Moduliflexus flocculans]
MKSRVIGIVILVAIIAGGVAYKFVGGGKQQIELKGLVGGEKLAFLQNPNVEAILSKKYGVRLNINKAGSIEMAQQAPGADIDFLWPSSEVALELYKAKNFPLKKSEIIFNSPIVLYTWDLIAQALDQKGFLEQQGNSLFIKDMKPLLEMVSAGTPWSNVGVTQLFGKMAITTTDPEKSSSGNAFAGLVANILNGDVVDTSSVQAVLPAVRNMFARLGYMPPSSQDLFQQYLTKGIGDKPIIAGYESQAVEFSLQNKELWPKVKNKIRILYPKPTVWSSHPLIIVKDKADPLMLAMQDPELQKIAWEQHGFRTGLAGIQNDPKVLDVAGIPESITFVMPMPSPQVMEIIMSALKN